MNYETLLNAAKAECLDAFGIVSPESSSKTDGKWLLLLGPGDGFWDHFRSSPEWSDKQRDPVDRWSLRIIGNLARRFGGTASFPFGGPPYHPFYSWALASGEAWASPVSLLVHAKAGLMVSYRGALAFDEPIENAPPIQPKPCEACDQPCLEACPAGALTGHGYDVPACKEFLMGPDGREIKENGCAVRRACPVSQSYGRVNAQSGYHMKVFLGD